MVQLSSAGMILALLAFAAASITHRQDLVASAAEVLGMCAALLLGGRLSGCPASPAFEKCRGDVDLYIKKSRHYLRGLRSPGFVFIFCFVYDPHARYTLLVIFGFALGIVE